MRYRFRNHPTMSGSTVTYGPCGTFVGLPPCYQPGKQWTWTSYERLESMLDVNTENYLRKQNRGEIIINPMVKEDVWYFRRPIHIDGEFQYVGGAIIRNAVQHNEANLGVPLITGESSWQTVDDFLQPYASERNVAIAKAWANVDQSEMMALASLGELPETLKWFGDLINRLINVIRMFSNKRRVLESIKKMKPGKSYYDKDLLDLWMEFRYAVRPLIFEASQLMAALKRQVEGKIRFTARGYHKVKVTDSYKKQYGTSWYHAKAEVTTVRESIYRAGVIYDFDTTLPPWISTFGLDQWIETGYELTTLSFALDWIFNVGDLLSSWSLPISCSPLGSWVSEDHNFLTIYECEDDPQANNHGWTTLLRHYDQGDFTEGRRIYRRQDEASRPLMPSLRLNLSVAKIVDLLAIGRSLYRTFLRR